MTVRLQLPTVRFRKWLWHGVGSLAAWEKICAGEGLRLPSVHAHDVGDYGYGVYLTDNEIRARTYSHITLDRKALLVKALVHLDLALIINWRGKELAFSKKHPAWPLMNALTATFGDPVRGGHEARTKAAQAWRHGLLARGLDGIVIVHSHDTEVVVFDPKKSLRSYRCKQGEPSSWV